jgi:predicted transcriptional regulator
VSWRNRLARLSVFSETVPLPMRRQDIADFLGLKLETVSRTLAKLEQKNVIRIVPKKGFSRRVWSRRSRRVWSRRSSLRGGTTRHKSKDVNCVRSKKPSNLSDTAQTNNLEKVNYACSVL